MKLVIAITPQRRASVLVATLLKDGFRVTRTAGTGGFLGRRNAMLLVGAEEGEVERIVAAARRIYRPTRAAPSRSPQTGGVTLFVLALPRMVQV